MVGKDNEELKIIMKTRARVLTIIDVLFGSKWSRSMEDADKTGEEVENRKTEREVRRLEVCE